MKIEIVDINTIKPYENNPRKLKDSAIEKVENLLKNLVLDNRLQLIKKRLQLQVILDTEQVKNQV